VKFQLSLFYLEFNLFKLRVENKARHWITVLKAESIKRNMRVRIQAT